MNQVVKVARIGKSALSLDPRDFIFHSSYNSFKIIVEGTKDLTILATTPNQEFTQAHGLEFIPLVTAFYIVNAGSNVYPVERIKTDATNITFTFNGGYSNSAIHVRYFCLEII